MHERGRLLVADDNKVNRLLLTRSLEQLGHRVSGVENGLQALELMSRETFDLLLLDIAMPELDGVQVLERIAADSRLAEVSVVVVSAVEGLERVVRCIELGADDYLHKPVNPVLLRARVSNSLEKKRLRDEQRETLRRFATPEVAQDMQRSGFVLGGHLIRGTVMFCDIRGFTSMAEQQSPEDTIELLNTFYTLMFDAIQAHGGVVNQMIGDGLMTLFGAPLPLANAPGCAVSAALEMQELIRLFNLERAGLDKPPIRIGIGVASGEMVAGYTGTQSRATYTCVGDAVNLAARLEAHTKLAGQGILIDDATAAALESRHVLLPLGETSFKGKSQPVMVYALPFPG